MGGKDVKRLQMSDLRTCGKFECLQEKEEEEALWTREKEQEECSSAEQNAGEMS